MTRGILGRAVLCAGLLAAWALPAHAQAIGSIFGKVTDASGAVLPGVNVSVAGSGLQTPLTSTTTDSGAYQFPSVPIGTYTVTFELQGFRKAVRNDGPDHLRLQRRHRPEARDRTDDRRGHGVQ